MKNYFEILGIEITNDEKIIKKAYAKLIKECSPEKDPVGFNHINKVYETLRDKETRKRYINELKIGKSFNELLESFYDAIESEDLIIAENIFSKLKLIDEDSCEIEKAYPRLLEFQGEYEKAINLYIRLQNKYNENAVDFNTGRLRCLLKLGRMEIVRIGIIDLLKVYGVVNYTLRMYIDQNIADGKSEENIKLIEELEKNLEESTDFDDKALVQWFKIKYMLSKKSIPYNFKPQVNKLVQYVSKSNNYFDLFIKEITQIIDELEASYRLKERFIILQMVEKYLKNDVDEEKIKHYDFMQKVCDMLDNIKENTYVEKSIIIKIYADIYRKPLTDENKYEELDENAQSKIDHVIMNNPEKIINSIKIIKNEYITLYRYSEKYFNGMYDIAKENKLIIDNNKKNEARNRTNTNSNINTNTNTNNSNSNNSNTNNSNTNNSNTNTNTNNSNNTTTNTNHSSNNNTKNSINENSSDSSWIFVLLFICLCIFLVITFWPIIVIGGILYMIYKKSK